MPIGDIYEVVHAGFSNENERWNNVFHWELVEDVGASFYDTAQALAEELAQVWSAQLLPLMSDAWELTDTRANRVYPAAGVPYATGTGAGYGLKEGQSLPGDVAAVLTKRTDQPTGRFRGRTYIGGLTEDDNVNGQMTPQVAGAFADAYDTYFNSADPDGIGNLWIPQVFSRSQVADGAEPVAASITRIQVDRILRNMRPRSTKVATYVNPSDNA